MQREKAVQHLDFEAAVATGVLMANNDKYRRQRMAERQREWRRLFGAPKLTGKARVSGWEELARVFPGPIQQGGDRWVQA